MGQASPQAAGERASLSQEMLSLLKAETSSRPGHGVWHLLSAPFAEITAHWGHRQHGCWGCKQSGAWRLAQDRPQQC